MSSFTDKVILITGAGRGIGRSIAEAFAAYGAIIAANDITPINLDETLARILASGGRVKDYVFDVAKKMPVQSMVEQVVADWGRIDILVNNAGVEPRASLLDMDEWDWHRTIDVNLGGPFFTMQTVGRIMRQQGGGVIVNIASTAGRAHGQKSLSAYIASKMGLIGLTREAARELSAYNIRVNAVCPGAIESERAWLQGEPLPAPATSASVEWEPNVPLGRPGHPHEVAEVVLFLCSDTAAYITGQAINVDGGQVMS
jgi:3-oxoacyl-[acyl-carrier protein] reductase